LVACLQICHKERSSIFWGSKKTVPVQGILNGPRHAVGSNNARIS
jgi:hypothetical protein